MSLTLKAIVACGLLLLFRLGPVVAWAADPVLEARVDRSEVAEGETILLTLTLEGFSRQATEPRLPRLDGFEVYNLGSSTNISLINGRLTSSRTETFQLVARRVGTYTLGPIQVEDKGRVYETQPITLRVVLSGVPVSPPAATGSPSGRTSGGTDGARGLFVELEADRTEVFVDQQVLVRFKLFQRADQVVYEFTDFSPPQMEGFWREDLGQRADQRVRRDGELYTLREVEWALYPTKAGELEIGPASVVAAVPDRTRRGGFGSLFSRKPVKLTSRGLRLRVKSLPQAGQPPEFTGSVGQYEVSAALDGDEARQGEALALVVTVSGVGHIQTIGAPVWPEWEGLRVFDSGEAVSVNKGDGRVGGEKTFTQVLVPTRSGQVSLAPVRFAYFDPELGRYVTTATEPFALQVLPAGSAGGVAGSPSEVVALGEDILYIRTDVGEGLARTGSVGPAWLLHLIPLALAGGALWVRGRRRILERNPILARRLQALRLFQDELRRIDGAGSASRVAAALADAVEGFLGDWLGEEVRGLRRSELEARLREIGAPEEGVAEGLGLLAWADDVRFGAGDSGRATERVAAAGVWGERFDAALRRTTAGAMG